MDKRALPKFAADARLATAFGSAQELQADPVLIDRRIGVRRCE